MTEKSRESITGAASPQLEKLCACVSEDAERCIALRYPNTPDLTDDGEPERCGCFCHEFDESER